MFKKKSIQPQPAAVAPKAGVFKKLERRFFSFFNSKAERKTVLLMSALSSFLVAPDFVINSTQKAQEDNNQFALYTTQINKLTQDSHRVDIDEAGSITFQLEKNAKPLNLHNRTTQIAHSLALDDRISEQEAHELARKWMNDFNGDPVISAQLRELMSDILHNSEYLEEARKQLIHDKDFQKLNGNERAVTLVAMASELSANHLGFSAIIRSFGELALISLLGGALLAFGVVRNKKLEKEQQRELFSDSIAAVRAMLIPKNNPSYTIAAKPSKRPTPFL